MTTTTVPIEIVCPDWCTIDAAAHAAALSDLEGECFHHSPEITVEDTSRGPARGAFDEPKPANPFVLSFIATTSTAGRESCSPMFSLETGSNEVSLEHLEALVAGIGEVIALYRSWEGSNA